MALGTPVSAFALAGAGSTPASASTASFTPSAGDLVFVLGGARIGSNTAVSAPTISDTAGWSWTQLANGLLQTAGSSVRFVLWCAFANGSANVVTLTQGATPGSALGIAGAKISGATSVPTNISPVATNTSGDPTTTLPAAPAATSTVLGFFLNDDNGSAVTPPTGTTEIVDGQTFSFRNEIVYDDASAATSWSFASAGICGLAASVEVRANVAYTLTATGGSYSISGAAATLRYGYRVAAATGTYALNGTAANFRKALRLIAAAGSYGAAGPAVTLRLGYKMISDGGSHVLAGLDAILSAFLRDYPAEAVPPERTAIASALRKRVTVPGQRSRIVTLSPLRSRLVRPARSSRLTDIE